jgi:hypothetical protein
MPNDRIGQKKFRVGEWVVIFGVGAVTVATTELLHLSPPEEHAIVYTAIIFAIVIVTLRPLWGYKTFWWGLVAIFGLHTLAMIVLEQGLPVIARGFHGIPLTIAGMIESVLIAGALWRRSMRSKVKPS